MALKLVQFAYNLSIIRLNYKIWCYTMENNRLLVLFSVFLITLVLMTAGCVDQESTQASISNTDIADGSDKVDVIRLTGADYGYPQPFSVYPRGPGAYKVGLIFDTLIEKDEIGLIPWLAESWEVSSDGTEYTFNLRDDVTWSDGEPFTANDVKFTYDYEQEYIPISGGIESGLVDSVEIMDDNTVKFILVQPNSPFLSKIASFRIIPEHIYEDVSDPATFLEPEAVVGTGPFLLDEYNAEHGSYRFVTNDNFWGPDTAVEAIEFIPVSDELVAFEQGEIDFTGISPDTLDRFTSDSDVKVLQQPAVWAYQLYLNLNNCPELSDKKIRQALAYAIDREELVEKIGRGTGKAGKMGMLSEDHVWYNPDQPAYEYDPQKAGELLDEGGWTDTDDDGIRDKDGEKLSYVLTLGSDEVRIGELIKARLGEVGIDVQVQALESKSRDANRKSGNFEILISGGGGWGQDADLLRVKFCNTGSQSDISSCLAAQCSYQNDTLNALGDQEVQEFDDEERKELVYEMQAVLAEDVPAIQLYYTTPYDAWRISTYDGWMNMFDHHARTHSKLSYLVRDGVAAKR